MNWLRCDYEGFEILGTRHIRRLSVEAGPEVRTQTRRFTDGSSRTTTHPALPGDGWLIVAWCGGSGPRCVACYESEQLARNVLSLVFAEMRDGSARAVDVPAIRAKLRGQG
jgi:hypothetical protein